MPDPLSNRRTLRDAARYHSSASVPQAKPAAPPKPDAKPPQVKQVLTPTGYEEVPHSCGHNGQFPLYAEKQDRFRQQRKAKFISKLCVDCREAKMAENVRKQREASAAKGPKPSKFKRKHDRLPDQSSFTMVYNATSQQWVGTMIIPSENYSMSSEAPTLFGLCIRLDTLYRTYKHIEDSKNKTEVKG